MASSRSTPPREFVEKPRIDPESPLKRTPVGPPGTHVPAKPATDDAPVSPELVGEGALREPLPAHGVKKESGSFARVTPPAIDVLQGSRHLPPACSQLETLSSRSTETGATLSDETTYVADERSRKYLAQVRVVGARLSARLAESGMSMRELARKLGWQPSQVSKIMNGKQPEMSAGSFFELCEALQIDPMKAWYGDTRRPMRRPSESEPPASSNRPSAPPKIAR